MGPSEGHRVLSLWSFWTVLLLHLICTVLLGYNAAWPPSSDVGTSAVPGSSPMDPYVMIQQVVLPPWGQYRTNGMSESEFKFSLQTVHLELVCQPFEIENALNKSSYFHSVPHHLGHQ
ncbi:hypothetical protein KIL84_011035 [Mauremys mutica]|uniref:Uncharacterized protein n=1 Tax=Mauremys mutica TaxID=74926 RepID=A0A9D3XCP7_9SAUR|nr:hypothetical protein KIL84_011035 [Mauremys mutica]